MPISRRDFIASSAALTAASLAPSMMAQDGAAKGASVGAAPQGAGPASGRTLGVGVIGCGGRGTGAAADALRACPQARVVAMADLLPERVASSRANLAGETDIASRVVVDDAGTFTGFDGFRKLLERKDVDVVLIAGPPGFRPMHVEAAINAGKHVFMEKPVAVDPAGVRRILAAGAKADQQKLCVVTGTQRRHERSYIEAMQRLAEGAIGKVVAARCYWNQGGLWVHQRKPEYSDMEWQCRNWLYFPWLSGDHIVEQHVHNLDVVNWAMGGPPSRVMGVGGRQCRTGPECGTIFDHFALEYEYPNGASCTSMCRQIDGCPPRVEEVIVGTEGTLVTRPGFAQITPRPVAAGGSGAGVAKAWRFEGDNPNPYEEEHRDLFGAILSGRQINEAKRIAESTLTAIMGRLAAYTGQVITWDQALNSQLDLSPAKYEFGDLPVGAVAMPGRTKFV